ncbi:alpha/beta fold hydrolase [Sediminibacter sp. Hel_I_10]|uniref:alpha/beta fold hydrolase n=1 Tax=Sediminibacter sp. Hel_I_10 TaxID=1392490 RepID=UPI0009DE8EC9|nr:alpha/beta fold hydrolase [Sediminibacter sp. Hel_I_10]
MICQIKKWRITLLVCLGFSLMNGQEVYPGKAKKVEANISDEFSFESKYIDIGAEKIHYVESGEGDPVLLLHGLPSWSYLWRNVIPEIDSNKQVIALDFLGFGKSSFPKDRNVSVEAQYKMLTDFIEAKQLKNVTLFVQDIGSLVGMLYVMRQPDNVKAIALFEAPFMPADYFYNQFPLTMKLFTKLISRPQRAERWMVKKNFAGKNLAVNFFTGRKLSKEIKDNYTKPWDEKERRYAMVNGPDPGSLPKNKGKGDSDFEQLLNTIAEGMKKTETPILYFYAKRGLINQKEAVEYARENFKNYTEVYLGKGKHFLTESHPKQMGEEFNKWYENL